MMKRRTVVLLCILAILSLVIAKKAVSQPSQTSSSPGPIALYEGQILIIFCFRGENLEIREWTSDWNFKPIKN